MFCQFKLQYKVLGWLILWRKRNRILITAGVFFLFLFFLFFCFLSLAKSFRTTGIGKLKVTLIEGVDLIASDPNGEFYITLGFPLLWNCYYSDLNPPLTQLETKNISQVPSTGKRATYD